MLCCARAMFDILTAQVVRLLVQTDPAAATMTNNDEDTPLHLGVENEASAEVSFLPRSPSCVLNMPTCMCS